MLGKIIIRRMVEEDLEKVSSIEREIFPDPWSCDAFKTDLHNNMAYPLVAELNKLLAGYVSLYVVGDEAQIGNFAVSPNFRKKGVGKALMNEIFNIVKAKGCASIFLEVRESNSPALRLYESFGFKTIGYRKNYYSNPRENAIVMAKEI